MIQKKIVNQSEKFKPFPFNVSKLKRGGIEVSTPPIKWDLLSEDEFRLQLAVCLNTVQFLEKEGVIKRSELETYLYSYMKDIGYTDKDVSFVKSLYDWERSISILSMVFLIKNGFNGKRETERVRDRIKELVNKRVVKEKKAEPQKPAIKKNMAKALSDTIGELQDLEDEKLNGPRVDVLRWLRDKNVAKVHVDPIIAKFEPILQELKDALEKKDPQLVEGYSIYKKPQLKAMIDWYERLINDLENYKRVKQVQRKVRVKKPQPPSKIVRRLKYMTYSDDLKIQSVNPEKLVGATQIWVYNQKYKKLGVYNASEFDKSMSVRGSTIIGWDPNTSVCKTLRKPIEQLKDVMDGGKIASKNAFKGIKSKEFKMNGRFNKETLILKVF